MADFTDIEVTKQWLTEKNVLFVTNSLLRPGGTFLSSLLCYANRIPIHYIAIIPGTKQHIRDGKRVMEMPRYGIEVFDEITRRSFHDIIWKQFDYVVYIDDDCFVTDFSKLMQMLYDFMNSGCCFAGPQDGGVFCHRNHSHIMINTFLSFWNTKLLRELTSFDTVFDYIRTIHEDERPFTKFKSLLSDELSSDMHMRALETIQTMQAWRHENWPVNNDGSAWSPYANTVTNDPNNPIEPHQTPYSYKNETDNFEPYYLIEQAWVLGTKRPVAYFNATDFYDPEENPASADIDNSGLTSAVMDADMNIVAVHTWFSRMYSKFPLNQQMLEHTKRINKIIAKYAVL